MVDRDLALAMLLTHDLDRTRTQVDMALAGSLPRRQWVRDLLFKIKLKLRIGRSDIDW
jgi:hypothetical protein